MLWIDHSNRRGEHNKMHEITAFIKQFFSHPMTVSSVVPSSKSLSLAMVCKANIKNAKVVLEFGCGSGAITESIVPNLSHESIFIAFDINKTFVEIVKQKYPNIIVINDSVENVESYMKQYSIDKADVIISSLPWSAFDRKLQIKLLRTIQRILKTGGDFLTYTYLHSFVMPSQNRFKKILNGKFRKVDVSSIVLANLPPAAVIKCIK